MTRFEQDPDSRLRRAHARFSARAAERPETASPARVVLGVVRAAAALACTAVRSGRGEDPIGLRPRVLSV